jgi:hypothetical protein
MEKEWTFVSHMNSNPEHLLAVLPQIRHFYSIMCSIMCSSVLYYIKRYLICANFMKKRGLLSSTVLDVQGPRLGSPTDSTSGEGLMMDGFTY